MRPTFILIVTTLALTTPAAAQGPSDPAPRIVIRDSGSNRVVRETRAYQGRNTGPEQTERFTRKVRIARDGRVNVSNITGDINVTAGSGDEVSIEAVKRTRGDAGQLSSVRIDVEERGGGVFVSTTHTARNDRVSVDYTITMPASATADVHSISGNVRVTGVRGAVRAETISGNVVASDTPKLEVAKSTSGNVTLSGVSTDGDLAAASVSGNVIAKSVKVHALELGSVSGDISVTDVSCDRLSAKSTSGSVEYAGSINKGGSYDINVHSGEVRMSLANPAGFVLNANSFSGTVRSDLPLTIGGNAGGRDRDRDRWRDRISNRSMRAVYGDGSATLTIRTFSGNIIISKR